MAEEIPEDLIDWVGQGKRYATVADMARDAMRWHDEAQAEKMASMELAGRLSSAERQRDQLGRLADNAAADEQRWMELYHKLLYERSSLDHT